MLAPNSFGEWCVVAKILTPDKLKSELSNIVNEFSDKTKDKINTGIQASLIETWGNIIIETPVDEGRARQSWFVGERVTSKVGRKSKANNRATSKIPNKLLGKRLFLYNNLPYIRTLEFGGYSRSNSGNPESKVTSLGFSKLAPRGMVRRNTLKWPKTLRGILKRL